MIDNISIHNFRGLKNIVIPDLKQFNVFLGKNNCGKSSLLDAFCIALHPTSPQYFIGVNDARRFHTLTPDDLKMNFFNADTSYPIELSASINGNVRTLTITYQKKNISEIAISDNSDNKFTDKDYFINFHIVTEDDSITDTNLAILHDKPDSIKFSESESDNFPKVHYITPIGPYRYIERFFADAVLNKQEKNIVKILHSIDPRVNDILFVSNRIFVDIGLDSRIPIQLMGDGMRKALALIISFNMIPNGVLLIDEIDNGLHYTAMTPMWKAVIEAAIANNVQIFVTTHNIDSLRSLNHCLAQYNTDTQNQLSVYSIRNFSNSDVKAIRSSYSQFSHLLEEELELR